MPLSERIKVPVFKAKIGNVIRQGVEFCKKQMLDVIFVLLIASNFFIEMKLILALFIILYFADKWQIVKLLLNKEEHYDIKNYEQRTPGSTGG